MYVPYINLYMFHILTIYIEHICSSFHGSVVFLLSIIEICFELFDKLIYFITATSHIITKICFKKILWDASYESDFTHLKIIQ